MDGGDALREQFGDPVPVCLATLEDSEPRDPASAVSEARVAQAAAMDVAIENALKRLPPVLRGAVRIILRG
jgi:hypothetical protein